MSEYLVKTPNGSKIRCVISDKERVSFGSLSLGNCHFGGYTGPMYGNIKRPNNKDQYYVGAFYMRERGPGKSLRELVNLPNLKEREATDLWDYYIISVDNSRLSAAYNPGRRHWMLFSSGRSGVTDRTKFFPRIFYKMFTKLAPDWEGIVFSGVLGYKTYDNYFRYFGPYTDKMWHGPRVNHNSDNVVMGVYLSHEDFKIVLEETPEQAQDRAQAYANDKTMDILGRENTHYCDEDYEEGDDDDY